MATVHTDAPAIFSTFAINEAEDDIKFVKVEPVLSTNKNSTISFEIPGKSSRYTDLRNSYIQMRVHVEETDAFSKSKPDQAPEYFNVQTLPFANAQDSFIAQLTNQEKEEERSPPGPGAKRRKRDGSAQEESITYQKLKEMQELSFRVYLKALKTQERADAAKEANNPAAEDLQSVAQGEMLHAEELCKQYFKMKLAYTQQADVIKSIIPIDNIFHSMWSDVEIHMNNSKVNDSNRLYMYKAYIETLLNNSNSTKIFQLQSLGYYGDTGNKDEFYGYTYNDGMSKRHQKFAGNRVNELTGYLLDDVMGVSAAIVNAVRTVIKLIPNYENIRLQTFGKNVFGKIVIDDIYMMVCQRKMADEVLLAHNEIMQKKPASYPFKKAEMAIFHGKKGDHSIKVTNPYESKIPTRLIVGMVNASAHAGDFSKNPLRFQHYNVKKAGFYIDNESACKPPYELSPSQGLYMAPYLELFSILGKFGEDQDMGLTPENFLEGNFLLPFDVVPTAAGNLDYIAKKDGGTCSLEIYFSEPLPEDIYVLTYGVFPYVLEIDAARNVFAHPL